MPSFTGSSAGVCDWAPCPPCAPDTDSVASAPAHRPIPRIPSRTAAAACHRPPRPVKTSRNTEITSDILITQNLALEVFQQHLVDQRSEDGNGQNIGHHTQHVCRFAGIGKRTT